MARVKCVPSTKRENEKREYASVLYERLMLVHMVECWMFGYGKIFKVLKIFKKNKSWRKWKVVVEKVVFGKYASVLYGWYESFNMGECWVLGLKCIRNNFH